MLCCVVLLCDVLCCFVFGLSECLSIHIHVYMYNVHAHLECGIYTCVPSEDEYLSGMLRVRIMSATDVKAKAGTVQNCGSGVGAAASLV